MTLTRRHHSSSAARRSAALAAACYSVSFVLFHFIKTLQQSKSKNLWSEIRSSATESLRCCSLVAYLLLFDPLLSHRFARQSFAAARVADAEAARDAFALQLVDLGAQLVHLLVEERVVWRAHDVRQLVQHDSNHKLKVVQRVLTRRRPKANADLGAAVDVDAEQVLGARRELGQHRHVPASLLHQRFDLPRSSRQQLARHHVVGLVVERVQIALLTLQRSFTLLSFQNCNLNR